jgi:phosphohistidine phosphatase
MRLYLVQHGRAKTEHEDPERPLTDRGREDVARVAHQAVSQLGVGPARILHSGKTRALQTAQTWGELVKADLEQADVLSPNNDPAIWVEHLRAETDDLMLVGHLPHLARLAGILLMGTPDRSVLRFQHGGLVGLERSDEGWVAFVVIPTNGA